MNDGTVVWEFQIRKRDMAVVFRMGVNIKEPSRTFQVQQGILSKVKNSAPPLDVLLSRIMAGLPKSRPNGQQLLFVGHLQDEIAITESYYWADGKDFFKTSTKHLRSLLVVGNSM